MLSEFSLIKVEKSDKRYDFGDAIMKLNNSCYEKYVFLTKRVFKNLEERRA